MKQFRKQVTAFCISLLFLLSALPMTALGADDAVSVTFGGSTTNYATIDAAWAAAVALDTTEENKATVRLLADCTAENTLTDTEDYLVLDTNGKTLTTPTADNQTSFTCGICVEGGSLELIGGGTVTGVSQSNYHKAILLINGGKVTANGITIHNTGTNGSNPVRIAGGEFYLIDSHLITDDEYALYADKGKVYLYSGTLETGRTARMVTVNGSGAEIQICYSEQPLYFVMRRAVWRIIDNTSYFHLEDNLVMDLEYSDNPDGSDSQMLRNVTQIDDIANEGRSYLKIQTYKPSYLFSTNYNDSLLKRVKNDGITTYSETEITAVHFVDLADYDLTNVACSDYSAKGDGSVKAWMDDTELYIGGYRKIIAGRSLNCAFRDGKSINSITGLDLLDTSRTTDMGYVFNNCGYNSSEFTLDLGDNFDTSNATKMVYMFGSCGYKSTKFSLNLRDEFDTSKVTDMSYMFIDCGRSSPTFTLDLGDRFDTSNVTTMYRMFERCGYSSTAFTTLDLSTFRVSADTNLSLFAEDIPVTKFIFGRGWRNATVAMKYNKFANSSSDTPTEIVGATKNLLTYDWASNNRTVTFTDNVTYTITALAEGGGSVRGDGTVLDGESITLTAVPAPNGYSLEGWYEGDTKVCDTEEFVIEDASDDKTYTAKFIQTTPYYLVTARVKDSGGQVSGGDDVPEGGSVTLVATPDAGYTFDGWYDGDTKVCDTTEFVVSNITESKTYIARFARIIVNYTISAEVGETGGGTVSGGGKVEKGKSVTLTATPDAGYTFEGWYDGEKKVCDTEKFTVSNVTADKTYTAKFTEKVSCLFSTDSTNTLLSKIKNDGVTTYSETEITAVHFVDLADYDLTNVTCSDYSAKGDGSVKAWMDDTELYIGGYKKITAGKSLANAFYNGRKIDSIAGLDLLDTSKVTDMSRMFYQCAYDSTVFKLDFGKNFDTSMVTDMSSMFYCCGMHSTGFTLTLGDRFDTSKVTDMSYMFSSCGYLAPNFTLDLGELFHTSEVTNMSGMFSFCGQISKVFTLDLKDQFDTSKVTNMSEMFQACGQKSLVFTLDFGELFHTSEVTNMNSMFSSCGQSSSSFTLHLKDQFDTSKVTDMKHMFSSCGQHARSFTLDLGKNFDTSKVTNMRGIFANCGQYSKVFTLDLGDRFDTSNVTNMARMFFYTGYISPVFTLTLGNRFDTAKATTMEEMFYYCGSNSKAFTTLDLSAFQVSTDTDLSGFAMETPITTFLFGEGWANATLPATGSETGAFYAIRQTDTTVVGATKNLSAYDWASDNRSVTGLQPNTYTVTATAETGGTVSGGGEVAKGSSITLTASANDGYTFAGWYDGDEKVCDTAEFTVKNVTADKTYTAKFTKNQVVDPDPEEPDIPYLKWDGSALTLVKKASASCRVGIIYVGGATFDADNINWDRLVAAGKEYTNLNSTAGYAVYGNFTKRTPGTRGNYVAFVKYTKEDGTTAVDYMTFNVKNAATFEIPALSYNPKTKTLKMKGSVSATVGVAYVGDAAFRADNVIWDDFITAGKKYPSKNGINGYARTQNTLDYTKTFGTNGNYVAFIKYFDENLNKSFTKYYTFTVSDYDLQPTDAPFAVVEEDQIILTANGFNVTKVTIVYIGTEDVYLSNWSEFAAAAAKFPEINGSSLKQQYTNPKDSSRWKQNTAGWYGVYIRYTQDGETCHSYYTVELN